MPKPTILKDEHDNTAEVAHFGSEKVARKALESLVGCRNCRNCSHCSGCSHCSHCSHCSDCSGCSGCSVCYGCSGCYDCSHCSHCSGCSRCCDCCDCSGCSHCSHCSRCCDCCDCSGCYGRIETISAPAIPDIHRTLLQAVESPGALNMSDWHTCDTTHCRAGWVVHLAGEAGYDLERRTSPVFAALQIYKASGYDISPVRFFDSNEDAMADMRRLAAKGTAPWLSG